MWLSILTQKLIPYGESDHLEVKIFRKKENLFAKEKKIILNKLKRRKSFCSRKIPTGPLQRQFSRERFNYIYFF